MRTELELSMYTIENTVFHLLRRRYVVLASKTGLPTPTLILGFLNIRLPPSRSGTTVQFLHTGHVYSIIC
jgi:hypothetical protein